MVRGKWEANVKNIFLTYLIFITAFTFTGCSFKDSFSQEPPEIIITVDNQTIDYVVGKNKWNGGVYDREDTLKSIMKVDSKIVVPYIKLDKMLNIEFKQNPPKTIEIFDYLLNENGETKYDDKTKIQIPVKLKDGKCSFEFTKNMVAGLSSNSEDYKAGKTLRGFKVTCRWGNNDRANECEYGFIIRTDSGFRGE